MPELPEVEVISGQLNEVLVDKVIDGVEVLREKSAQSDLKQMEGKKIVRVWRKAKNVLVELQDTRDKKQKTRNKLRGTRNYKQETINSNQARLCLMVHLKMTGQLIFDENDQISNSKLQTKSKFQSNKSMRQRKGVVGGHPPGLLRQAQGLVGSGQADLPERVVGGHPLRFRSGQASKPERIVGGHPTVDWIGKLPSKHTRIIVGFDDGSKLYFNDQRVFGWMKVVTRHKLQEIVDKLPPDVVEETFTVEYLAGVLSRSGRAVKLVILDQQKMGGMGNIYANDALHMARVGPGREARTLSRREVGRLHKAMVAVLRKGIETGGASYSDYVQVDGMGGSYQEHFVVYDKEGGRCPRKGCGGVIEKVSLGGRGTYFCPECQGK